MDVLVRQEMARRIGKYPDVKEPGDLAFAEAMCKAAFEDIVTQLTLKTESENRRLEAQKQKQQAA